MSNIEKREITTELRESYLDYAMSVIVSRALPDVRDGLKPVQRRILWAMWDAGITSSAKFRKSAYVVGECFIPGTLITASNGLKPIEEVTIGDSVYTQSGVKKVIGLYKMPPKDLFKVTLSNGMSVTVTPSQKLKVIRPDLSFDWREAKELNDNDYLVLRSANPNIDINKSVALGIFNNKKTIHLDKDLAYLLGLFTSDGWITNEHSSRNYSRIGFVSEDKLVLEKIKLTLLEKFDYQASVKTKKKEGYKTVYLLMIHRKRINEFLARQFDLYHKNAVTKEIPKQIFNSPPEVIFSFVSGLIEGDGCISPKKNRIQYCSVSEKLTDQFQALLFSQGIFSSKYKTGRPGLGHFVSKIKRQITNRHQAYSLEITGKSAANLAEKLSLIGKARISKIESLKKIKFTQNSDRGQNIFDIIPYAGASLFKELSSAHLGGGWYEDSFGVKFRSGIKYPSGSKIRYSSDLAEKPLRTTQVLEWGIRDKLKRINSPFLEFIDYTVANNLHFLKVVSIEKSGASLTYDLQVETDHEFLANGIVSHNCLGKYHPHGDMAVYDAMVRMAQDFSLRYPLVQGQGNFGSSEDNAAASRYTEARLSKIAEELLSDIEKETVDWQPNYDATRVEPKVLPAKLPNLLLNGAVGIAVGMATNIPPHNLGEVVDATLHLIDHPKAQSADLMNFIQGPDFPTGGIIYSRKDIVEAYVSGRGGITTRALAEIKERKGGKEAYDIVINEIPYQVNKSELIIKMAELVQEKRVEGIRDIRDESDKDGLRVVIELKNDATPQKVLNQLYNHTDLQKDFHLNMIALSHLPDPSDKTGKTRGLQPQIMSLKDILSAYVTHRQEVVRRRAEFDLKRAEERAHILEGLVKALSQIDKIIATIKKSADRDEAQKNLIKNFKFTEIQANAILEMRLSTLAALEREKIDAELKEKRKLIADLKLLLKSPEKIMEVIKNELKEIKAKYADHRRTKVVASGLKEFKEEDLIPKEETVITFSQSGYIKRLPPNTFRSQRRGGKGLIGSEVAEEDFLTHIMSADTHDNILFFTDQGRVFQTKVWEIPEASRTAKGKPIHNFLEIPTTEKVNAIVSYPEDRDKKLGERFLVMLTKHGIGKKTSLTDFQNVRRNGIIAIKLRKGDALKWVEMSGGKDEVIITTSRGQSIRFKESQIRNMGRAASGVTAIRLKGDDEVSSLDIISPPTSNLPPQKLLVVMANGFGKQTPLKEYRLQKRGGSGIKTAKITAKTGPLMSAHLIRAEEEILAISAKGQIIRTKLADVRVASRATQGVKVMTLNQGDKLVGVICL